MRGIGNDAAADLIVEKQRERCQRLSAATSLWQSTMGDKIFRIESTNHASRSSAAELRSSVEQTAVSQGTALVDLSAVISVSEAYADELFGVLVARHGLNWLVDHVRLHARRLPYSAQ